MEVSGYSRHDKGTIETILKAFPLTICKVGMRLGVHFGVLLIEIVYQIYVAPVKGALDFYAMYMYCHLWRRLVQYYTIKAYLPYVKF